ncbi:MAG: transposase [Betaproteobacteria bacterium]|nr:transposase [Betaproteobacteria bacterium]
MRNNATHCFSCNLVWGWRIRRRLKCSDSIASLAASALAYFDPRFAPYLPCFQSLTRPVEGPARLYLRGLFRCRRRNMEKMAETVSGDRHQRLHHTLGGPARDRRGVRRQLVAGAGMHFGHACAPAIGGSASAEKGGMSAGVARQWNGRPGKTDNSRAGVFAATVRDRGAALAGGGLYAPEAWFADAARCRDAGIPVVVEFRTEGGMAPTMVHRLRRGGCVSPAPCRMPATGICRGCCASWRAGVKPSWRKPVRIRLPACPTRRRPVRREIDGSKLEFCLSDARPRAGLRRLADMRAARHFVERAPGDAGGARGVAGYQARGSNARHHRMAPAMVAPTPPAKGRPAHCGTAEPLSRNGLAQIMRHKPPSKIETDADPVASIEERHRRRQLARDFACRKQAATLSSSAGNGV